MPDNSDHSESSTEPQDEDETESRGPGAPKGNKNAQGNAGGPGAPEGNMRAMKHGVQADPFHLYDKLEEQKGEDAVRFVDELVDSYMDLLGFSDDDPRAERVRRACVHIYQSWAGEDQILEDGLSEDTVMGVSDSGEPIIDKDGHHLHRFTFKRDQEARQILRTLGAFDDPESQKADAIEDRTEMWRQFVEEGAGSESESD